MPVVKHGIAFKYFDKTICGVVALALLAGIVFALSRGMSAQKGTDPEKIKPILVRLETELVKKHHEAAPSDYIGDFEKRLKDVREPRTVPDNTFYMSLPVTHEALAISTDRQFVLDFNAPLAKGSITIEGPAGMVTLVEHPVDSDYSRVLLASHSDQGSVTVEGLTGDGVRHIYPVRVDSKAGKTAYPPEKLKVVSQKKGSVVLNIVPDPRNADEGVEVAEYEVWRRDWQDPLGAFRKVASVKAEEVTPLTRTPAPVSPVIGPYVAPAYGAAAQPEQPEGIYWEDRGVTPGRRYGYKVRMVGSNTYPAASDFIGPELADVEPRIDFRFQRSIGSKVDCDVIKVTGGATPVMEAFPVVAGDEIGGIVTVAGLDQSYLTGNVMLEFESGILLGRSATTDRMIYADPEGFLRERLRRESKIDKAEWDAAAAAAAAARRASVPGAGMPMPYGAAGLPR
jgi:hypothetical protein